MKILIIVLCILSQVVSGFAGLRGPGKYAGIPIFDRWDGCILYSGVYLMYVSEKVKETLRPYVGQAILVDAKQVWQPKNPGDGRIDSLKYLSSTSDNRSWVTSTGITLKTSAETNDEGKVIATISITNTRKKSIKLFSQELGLTILTKCPNQRLKYGWFVSDGPSYALIIRNSFEISGSKPRWQGKGITCGKSYSWTIGKENALPHDFLLTPGNTRNIRIYFDLLPGEYDFLCGYGRCLSSNLTAFDIDKKGKSKIVTIKGRQ